MILLKDNQNYWLLSVHYQVSIIFEDHLNYEEIDECQFFVLYKRSDIS